jgi:ankyrin repeat protein
VSVGGDVNVLDNDGDSPLLFCEDPETFELLLSFGANPQHRNFRGEGILEKAIDDENAPLIQYFEQKGYISSEQAREAITRIENGATNDDEEGVQIDMEELLAAARAEQEAGGGDDDDQMGEDE